MKKSVFIAALASAVMLSAPAHARKDFQTYSIQEAMASADFQEKLGNFKFVWGDRVSGQRIRSTSTRKTTSGLKKTDRQACEWALLSALIALKAQAEKLGGSSVQGIKSYATGETFSSRTEFQCISGFTNPRVYLEAEIVK
jgi:hypothetical protein